MSALCPFEDQTHEAVRSQSWPSDLAIHAQTCPHCASIVALHANFHQMAQSLHPQLPSSATMWVLANWEKQRYEDKRIRQRTTWSSAAIVGASILIGVIGSLLFGGHPLAIWKQSLVPLMGVLILWHINHARLDETSLLPTKM